MTKSEIEAKILGVRIEANKRIEAIEQRLIELHNKYNEMELKLMDERAWLRSHNFNFEAIAKTLEEDVVKQIRRELKYLLKEEFGYDTN